ncbi:sulfotransferase [Verrucomicrobiota bacterium]
MNSVVDKMNPPIFILSQPRAGSTMLQRILGGHPEVHTLSEPTFLLHPCYGLKESGGWAEYEEGNWAFEATNEFLRQVGGRDVYVRAVRRMAEVIYEAALAGSGKVCFLDKTPRYYFIINELAEVFPDARFIILVRNPLAVLCSIVRTWVHGDWGNLRSYRGDLLKAPGLIAEGMERLGGRAVVVRYEDLVQRPSEEVKRICEAVGLAFHEEMLVYGRSEQSFRFGDDTGVLRHDRPDAGHNDRWIEDIGDTSVWRLASDYLAYLGKDTMGRLGYDFAETERTLAARRPGPAARLFSIPLSFRLAGQGPIGAAKWLARSCTARRGGRTHS